MGQLHPTFMAPCRDATVDIQMVHMVFHPRLHHVLYNKKQLPHSLPDSQSQGSVFYAGSVFVGFLMTRQLRMLHHIVHIAQTNVSNATDTTTYNHIHACRLSSPQ